MGTARLAEVGLCDDAGTQLDDEVSDWLDPDGMRVDAGEENEEASELEDCDDGTSRVGRTWA